VFGWSSVSRLVYGDRLQPHPRVRRNVCSRSPDDAAALIPTPMVSKGASNVRSMRASSERQIAAILSQPKAINGRIQRP
jgi:hypothetical protein